MSVELFRCVSKFEGNRDWNTSKVTWCMTQLYRKQYVRFVHSGMSINKMWLSDLYSGLMSKQIIYMAVIYALANMWVTLKEMNMLYQTRSCHTLSSKWLFTKVCPARLPRLISGFVNKILIYSLYNRAHHCYILNDETEISLYYSK